MTVEEVRVIVEKNLDPMLEALGMGFWRVQVDFHKCENDNWIASCTRNGDYVQAYIVIDPDRHFSEKEVLESLRHEVLHLVLEPFDLYRELVTQRLKDGGEKARIEARAFTRALEQSIVNLEKLLHNMDAKKLRLVSKSRSVKE